ncbi:MAG TPA: family 10 glycosylhydrolase, partial [Planctomycetota bacterium]|nr:family 10 glycosylhydrolase [Planctomycetota bacterium]
MPFRSLLLLECLLLVGCTACTQVTAQETPESALVREFRGAWVATVGNSDWPSRPGLPVATLRAELDAIVQRSVELKLNALVFQVRPCADAFYASRLEPWSEWLTGVQGQAPAEGFDPLAYVIARCHEQGLQLHAWFNPYRASHHSSKSAVSKEHVLARLPSACVPYGPYQWMDPGDERAAKWSLAVIQDVVQRYDVDGVHIDDYFYPYPEKGQAFPDERSFATYREKGGRLAVADWRRANIDSFVQRMYEVVHEARPWVQVGISPFGIARPGVPEGIKAGIDQYAQLYADVRKWLREGWLDYLTPQLYWPI